MASSLQPIDWTFLSNHSHVLYCISSWPDIRIRDIAGKVQITERAVQRIVVDLERAGYLKRQRVGRQNRYRLEPELHLRHPLEHHVEVGQLLAILQPATAGRQKSPRTTKGSAVVTARGLNHRPLQRGATGTSRLKKGPHKRYKLSARSRRPKAKKSL